MTGFTDVFGGQTVPPALTAYRAIDLDASVSLFWPSNYEGPDFVAAINDVTPSTSGFTITLDDATAQSTGFDLVFHNVGFDSFTLKDNGGNTLAVVDSGVMKYLYLADNSTNEGVWRVTTYGTGTSSADASQLAGHGLLTIANTLNLAHEIVTSSSTINMVTGDRSNIYVATGGSVSLNLLATATAGNNFFVGVRNQGSGSLTITPVGGELIDGAVSLVLSPGESTFIICSGIAWYSVGYGRSTVFQFTKLVKDISAGGTFTLTTSEVSNKLLQFTGTPVSNATVIVPDVVAVYYIQNAFNGTKTVTIKTASGAGVTMSNTDRTIVYCDAVDVVSSVSTSVGTNISVVDGNAGSPAINFSSSTTTGIFKAAGNTVGISSAGVEVARFGSNPIIGKITFTSPTTGATITVADGKTFTASNTVTIAGTDGSTLTIGTGGTLGSAAYQPTTAFAAQSGNSIVSFNCFTLTASNTVVAQSIGSNIAIEAPIAPSLINGWFNVGAPYRNVGYWKDAYGVVHLQGLLQGGSTGVAFNLPSGYRPTGDVNPDFSFGGGISIASTGGVSLTAGSIWSLDSITFRTT